MTSLKTICATASRPGDVRQENKDLAGARQTLTHDNQ